MKSTSYGWFAQYKLYGYRVHIDIDHEGRMADKASEDVNDRKLTHEIRAREYKGI